MAEKKEMKYGVLGHRGMVGSAIVRALGDRLVWTYGGDLRNEIDSYRCPDIDYLFVCAGRVGGIQANIDAPVDFLRDNLLIALNVLEWAKEYVGKVIYLGSSCIYPRDCPQPMSEDMLLSGPLEPSNEGYALAKISGIKLCEAYLKQYGLNYLALMPCNLYGPGDNYDLRTAHVIPALIRRLHEAKIAKAQTVTLWGTGQPMREFMHVDDLAAAAVYLADRADGLVNVGSGEERKIQQIACLIASVVGFEGAVLWDWGKPDGTPRKLLDLTKMRSYATMVPRSLRDGLVTTYASYCAKISNQ